jgi:hypothetical protein
LLRTNTGEGTSPSGIPLLDKIMNPASWFTTIFIKPFYVLQVMYMLLPWFIRNTFGKTRGGVVRFFQAIRTSPPPFETRYLKVAAAGFCWGGKHVFYLARGNFADRAIRHESQANSGEPQQLLDCAFTAHPSAIEVPEDPQQVYIPVSVAIGDNDHALKGPKVIQMKYILETQRDEDQHEVVIIPGARHGFAIRNHPDDTHETECAERAEVQAIEWFDRWMTGTIGQR